MKYFFISFLLITFCEIYSQPDLPDNYILPLPEGLDSSEVNLDNLKIAMDRLHKFSEYIYNPIKITKIDSFSYSPINLTDAENYNRWGEGSWGRGAFSKYVDRFLFDGKENTAYNTFYNRLLSAKLKNHYWGTHPIVSYCARTALAYLNLYYSSDEVITKSFCIDRFINGTKYLIHQQQPNGGYAQWHRRKDKTSPNMDDNVGLNRINSYATANAIFALKNVYDYLKQSDDKSQILIEEIYNTIKKAGDFLVTHNNNSAHKNYISFSIWGLINAYNTTKNRIYIDTALNKYSNEIENFQDVNGAWYKNSSGTSDYHDAHSVYMGIILTALIDLYNVLPYSYYYDTKARLRKSIIKGINHFLLPNVVHSNFPNQDVRLAEDGGIYPYSEQKEYTRHKGRALQLSQALIYALKSDGLFSAENDILRLKGFLNAVMRFQVSETINTRRVLHINSDIYFHSLALYFQQNINSGLD
ncbi:MAG: hypothetical protein WBG58_05485 [Ignavibacteriaceae bacterium]|jgi:hypothetical protein